MSILISEDDLARARIDPTFRQQLPAINFDGLLTALNMMRRGKIDSLESARQMRERVKRAVKHANRLQQYGVNPGPRLA
jgi:hypothetical protein